MNMKIYIAPRRRKSSEAKWRWQLKTDQNGAEVWPNASTWMRVESRSRSLLLLLLLKGWFGGAVVKM